MKTIGVDLWADQIRGGGNNNVTCLQPSAATRPRRAFRELFISSYAGFAERLSRRGSACRGWFWRMCCGSQA